MSLRTWHKRYARERRRWTLGKGGHKVSRGPLFFEWLPDPRGWWEA